MEGGDVKEKSTLPPGFRFHPSDEELITYYLINKISDSNFTEVAVGDVDLNKWEPWDLPGKAKMGEKLWYFFSLRDRKYPTGVRTNRATNTGYWKTTGKDKEIYNSDTSDSVGMKKTLVFYKGRAPRGEKTNWVMHEYRIHSKSAYRNITKGKDEWVVCRIFQRSPGVKKYTSNHTRAINPYTFNNQQLPQNAMQHQIMQPENFQFPGRSYITPADIQEFNKVFRGGSANTINLPIPPQVNYGDGGGYFTISGLNLNPSGSVAPTQPIIRLALPPPPPGLNKGDATSSTMTNQTGGYVDDMNNVNIGRDRFTAMDQFADLDNYWPTY